MFMLVILITAALGAWLATLIERSEALGRERDDARLSPHERTRRERNRGAGLPWQYDVSAGRSGRLKERP